ncbi:hypothetical protein K438DRAFT_757115 [Mycena galopus ATCC 62051]|nr:hypothetical protein K438DRAFT_757115 [Mycena galopus ATCC 62051]
MGSRANRPPRENGRGGGRVGAEAHTEVGLFAMSTDPSARTDFRPFLPNVGPVFADPDPEAQGGERVIRLSECFYCLAFERYVHCTPPL